MKAGTKFAVMAAVVGSLVAVDAKADREIYNWRMKEGTQNEISKGLDFRQSFVSHNPSEIFDDRDGARDHGSMAMENSMHKKKRMHDRRKMHHKRMMHN